MDIRQTVTDKIVALLEAGTAQGSARWVASNALGMPKNGKTAARYQGVNVLILWAAAAERGYTRNTWMTYKQAADIGGQVRKGEKGTTCVYFEMVKAKAGSLEATDDKGFYPMIKAFSVFNVAQIDGLPEDMTQAPAPVLSTFERIGEADRLLAGSGAVLRHGFDKAYYSPAQDVICLPAPENFTSPENYYATALHELTHWTGAKTRLDRQFGKRFGDNAYAMEELVAELGSAFVAGHVGFVDATIENHADYLASWIKCLKADKNAIFTAAKQASRAYDLIVGGPVAPEAPTQDAAPEAVH